MGKGHKIPESIRQKVLEAVNAGIRYSDIARSFKIGRTSVRRIAKAAQKESPEAPTAMENASEETNVDIIDNTIIPDVPEVVKQEEIPGVVVDALLEKIQNISEKIETEEKYLAALKADKKSLERWYHENCKEEVKHGTR